MTNGELSDRIMRAEWALAERGSSVVDPYVRALVELAKRAREFLLCEWEVTQASPFGHGHMKAAAKERVARRQLAAAVMRHDMPPADLAIHPTDDRERRVARAIAKLGFDSGPRPGWDTEVLAKVSMSRWRRIVRWLRGGR